MEEKYENIKNNNLTIKIPSSILLEYNDASLSYKKLDLSDAQKNRYGKDSEIYEVSLLTKDNKMISLSDETITQTVKLSPNKKFDAIYVVREDGSIVKLNSEVNENNEAVFKDKGLGKYIISYKSDNSNTIDKEENKDNLEKEKTNSKGKTNYIPYILGGEAILLLGGVIYFKSLKKKKYYK